jgi:hypothetical protein
MLDVQSQDSQTLPKMFSSHATMHQQMGIDIKFTSAESRLVNALEEQIHATKHCAMLMNLSMLIKCINGMRNQLNL